MSESPSPSSREKRDAEQLRRIAAIDSPNARYATAVYEIHKLAGRDDWSNAMLGVAAANIARAAKDRLPPAALPTEASELEELREALGKAVAAADYANGCHGCIDNGSDVVRRDLEEARSALSSTREPER